MKKLVGMMMAIVMVFAVVYSAAGERVVTDHYAYEVLDWTEEWCKKNGYEQYVENDYTLDENGCFHGIGVMVLEDCRAAYGEDFNLDDCERILSQFYKGVEIEIRTIGFYEGYEVMLMRAKAEDPIGQVYRNGEPIDYYKGELIFMVSEKGY